ncbi:MAG: hypothetical protein ACR2I2_10320 [Bryobacteraceae bacterium]
MALKAQLRQAHAFLRLDKLTNILFADRDLTLGIFQLVDNHYLTAALKITQLFDWAARELETRRMEKMPRSTNNNQTNIIYGGTPSITQTGNVLTSGEFHNLASELARLRYTLQSQFLSTPQAETIELLQQAEAASNNKDAHKVQSVLQRISGSGWSAIKSVAPQITSQVILGFLKAHGLA